ncbi:cation/acetate symporter [Haloferula luteola]|uniref:Cation/acetate symporter n=1 Tax=Haloferula luteola TaxID=595692 RepID=A0A840V357_9BACT|nr:sodium:solute symporter family protein [Haloferula luteola]MBB5350094.1 cation/acetate symporter [Haloferula luteola]
MDVKLWTWILVGFSFAIYLGIAIWSRAGSTKDFYVAGGGVPSIANGMATGADWMSAASFLGMAGLISSMGRDGSVYLMGWTGGYVLLALLLAPYLRRFGKFTVPDFIGDRYYSNTARVVAVVCAIFVSFTYVAGQMRGVGIVFSRFLDVDINTGVIAGMAIVFFYAVLGGMKGITYTQVAQYCVLIFAFMVPAIFISLMLTQHPLPQTGLGATTAEGTYLLDKLDGLQKELGFAAYTEGHKPMIDVFAIALTLMVGTAGLPHVIVRFYTVKKVSDARKSAFWALLFIAILYTTAPAVSVFARTNLLETIPGRSYAEVPTWFKNWEHAGLIAWLDKNGDGKIQYDGSGDPFAKMEGAAKLAPVFAEGDARGASGERVLLNAATPARNELYIDADIIVLANPEIANLPNWVIGLVAAGGLAAALSTAAGLLLVISTSVAHDLVKRTLNPSISEKGELLVARAAAGVAVCVAGYFGIRPPGFVAQVVAFAFGLAASSFFPAIILGIFWKRATREGAVAGMICGLLFTACYICYFKFGLPGLGMGDASQWWWGISPEGIGMLGMLVNVGIAVAVSLATPAPPEAVRDLVERVRLPRAAFGEEDSGPVAH